MTTLAPPPSSAAPSGKNYDIHVERKNYSAMPLDGEQNNAAGILLAGFYTNNRMLDGPEDGFIV
ncbi:hypothetical protein [Streptomyces atratus]|uniref:hypothetical protein n=1 Tax=Streptomyces atratus TaxID=1893 RepID=UPI0021A75D52|nr:hypothetical protein [Streptomyces atratus]MCT2543382.1 hypothetical protein [Streptomyces atratus]